MRPGFNIYLHQLNEIAKDKSTDGLDETDKERLDHVLDWHINKAADRFHTPRETQNFVFAVQEKKRHVMQKLKERLRDIDNPFAEKEPNSRRVEYRDGIFYCDFKGRQVPVTAGEILTDVEWGISYDLDPVTVPKNLRKRYWLEVAKKELMDLLNEQLIESEIKTNESKGDFKKPLAYSAVRGWESRPDDPSISGQYAEREIRNFLRKLAIDCGGKFRISQSDIHQDVEQKIDFVVLATKNSRGVDVDKEQSLPDDPSDRGSVGIQFTISKNQEKIRYKREQIEKAKNQLAPTDKIKDIVLVQFHLNFNLQNVKRWIEVGKPPGGPEKNWDDATAGAAIRGVLGDLLPDDEIQKLLAGLPARPKKIDALYNLPDELNGETSGVQFEEKTIDGITRCVSKKDYNGYKLILGTNTRVAPHLKFRVAPAHDRMTGLPVVSNGMVMVYIKKVDRLSSHNNDIPIPR